MLESPRDDPQKSATIYRTAARIFNEKGYHATSIHEIADAVQLTKAGLYYYIKGKEDLLFAIMDFAMNRLESAVVEQASQPRDAEERLRLVVSLHARLITEDSSALTILVNELESLEPAHRQDIVARQRAYVHFLRENLESLDAEGRLAEVDPTVAAFGILGAILWLSRWYRSDGRLSGDQVVAELEKLVCGGVLKKGRAEPERRRA